jgi:23S rRNA pseudouridine1911/1915/1917 synthase
MKRDAVNVPDFDPLAAAAGDEDDLAEGLDAGPVQTIIQDVELTVTRRNERLDQYLVVALPGHSRSLFRRLIDEGQVHLNGQPAKASAKLRDGDRIHVRLPLERKVEIIPENIPLDIVYEDEHLAVVNKPANMVVHPARGNWSGTLVNGLRFHFDQLSGINGLYRPGIVHRLDRDTTGVIVVAKQEQAHRVLSAMFEKRVVHKEYHCLVRGVLDRDSDYVEKPIGRHPHTREMMKVYPAVDEAKGIKEACTFYEVIERFAGFTYCKAFPKTGRTHQIRVHLAAVGCPILADEHYLGQKEFRLSDVRPVAADEVLLSRQALHARRIRFPHPITQQPLEVAAPLPPEFERTLAELRTHRPWR